MKRVILKACLLVWAICSVSTASALDYYWVGNTGAWSDFSHHWATSSGGNTFYIQVPQSVDNVHFDANSFTIPGCTVSIDQTIVNTKDFDWRGVTNHPTLAGASSNGLRIFGSLYYVAGMTITFNGLTSFESTLPGNIISTSGLVIQSNLTFNGTGGWILADSLYTSTSAGIAFNHGDFNTAGYNCHINYVNSTTTGTLTLNTSTITIGGSGGWTMNGTRVLGASSTFIMLNGGAFTGGANAYGDIIFPAAAGTVNGNTFRDVYFGGSGSMPGTDTARNVTIMGQGNINGLTAQWLEIHGSASVIRANVGHIKMYNNGGFGGTCNCNQVFLSAGYNYGFSVNTVLNVTDTFSVPGTCGLQVNLSCSGGQATISHPAGTVTITHVNLQGIKAIGGATFTANNSIDLGGNTGWTINSPASYNLYWIGGTGVWSDGNHWSYTSGGAPSGCSPTILDNVFFDANSFQVGGQTVTIDVQNAYCNDMTWTGVTNNPGIYSSVLHIYGSLYLARGMTFGLNTNMYFDGSTQGKIIRSAGNTFYTNIFFNGGGGWTLDDSLVCSTNIQLNAGTVYTGGNNVRTNTFQVANGTYLYLDTSTFNIMASGGWTVYSNHVSAATSTFFMWNGGAFTGGANAYRDVTFPTTAAGTATANSYRDVWFGGSGSMSATDTARDVTIMGTGSISRLLARSLTVHDNAVNISSNNITRAWFYKNGPFGGNNTFGTLILTPGYNYTFTQNTLTTIIDTLYALGTCALQINLVCSTGQATMLHAVGTITIAHANLQGIAATGGGTFIANSSIDLGSNTGWTINAPVGQNLYWVGGTGAWSDGNHWSTTSGGAPVGCAPTIPDNVFFDANSFTSAGQTMTIDVLNAYCNDMTWTGVTNNPMVSGPNTNALRVYGSFTLGRGMTWAFDGRISFEALSPGKTITSVGNILPKSLYFNGTGSWTLGDSLSQNTGAVIYLNNGNWSTGGNNVRSSGITVNTTGTVTLDTSVLYVTGSGGWTVTSGTISGASSTFYMLNGGAFTGGNFAYRDVTYPNTNGGSVNAQSFRDIYFGGAGTINSSRCRNVYIGGQGTMYARDTVQHVEILGSAYISNLKANYLLAHQGGSVAVSVIDTALFLQSTKFGSNSFVDLTFGQGYTFTLFPGSTLTVQRDLNIGGTGSFPVRIKTDTIGRQATFSKPSGIVCVDFIRISDLIATGGATYYAGANSQDFGNNVGWIFTGGGGGSPTLQVAVSPQGSVCQGTNITYTATTNISSPIYQWYVNGVLKQNDTIATYSSTNLLDGDSVTCTISSHYPCVAGSGLALSTPVSIIGASSLQVAVSGPSIVCPDVRTVLTAAATNTTNPTYQWFVNGVSKQNDTLSTFNADSLADGDMVVCLLSGLSLPCSVQGTAMDTFIASVPAASTNLSVDHSIICSGDSAHLCGPQGYSVYLWNTGEHSSCIVVTTPGDYTLKMLNNNGCYYNSNQLAITVNIPAATVTTQNDTLFASAGSTYQWMQDGHDITGANGAYFVPDKSGNYQVRIADSIGCSAVSGLTTFVRSGIPELLDASMSIYPNPSEIGYWNLDVGQTWLGARAEVFDAQGKSVYATDIKTEKSVLTVNAPAGVYILKLNSEKGSITQKLVKL